MKKHYFIWILTLIVIVVSILILIINWKEVSSLKLNEIADFIGVIVSSLAFIWLIYGYYMQNIELNLQREELKNQVDSTRKLVEQSEFQTKADLEIIRIEKNKIKDEFTHRIRPVLVFYNTGKDKEGKNRWVLKNVGNSTAINLLVSCGAELHKWTEKDTVLFPALTQNETIVLNWISRYRALVTIYSDIEDNEYTTICIDNKNKINKGNIYPDLKPDKFEYQLQQNQMKII